MNEPQTIIELDYNLSNNEINWLKKLLDENFDIKENKVNIYNANNYVDESRFADEIYDKIFNNLKKEYV